MKYIISIYKYIYKNAKYNLNGTSVKTNVCNKNNGGVLLKKKRKYIKGIQKINFQLMVALVLDAFNHSTNSSNITGPKNFINLSNIQLLSALKYIQAPSTS